MEKAAMLCQIMERFWDRSEADLFISPSSMRDIDKRWMSLLAHQGLCEKASDVARSSGVSNYLGK